MKRNKKEKAPKEKKERQSLKKIILNNAYMLRIYHNTVPKTFYLRFITSIINSAVNFLSGTYLLRQILNNYQSGAPLKNTVIMIAVIFGFLIIWNYVWNFIWLYAYNVDDFKLERHMKNMIYDKISTLELGAYENTAFYDQYVKVAGDALNRVRGVFNTFQDTVWYFTSFSLNGFLILSIDPFLVIFAIIPLITTFFLLRFDNKYMFEYNMKNAELERQRDYTRRTFYLSDFAKEMRLTHAGDLMLGRFQRTTKIIRDYMAKKLPLHAFLNLLKDEIEGPLCEYGAMIYAVYRTLVTHTMTYGDCVIVIGSISFLTYILSDFAKKTTDYQSHSLYVENLRKFLAYEPKVQGGEESTPEECADLIFHDVHFRYDGQEEDTICGIDIRLGAGEKIALVGHNGAGKTTIAKLMLRLYDPTGGKITYGGRDIKEYKLENEGGYRERFAVVFQDFKLFAMSVADNIILRKRRDGDDALISDAMKASGIDKKVETLPQKENTLLTREFDDNGTVLSGGEGQKVAISRSFVKDAQVVILDEPSSALDPIAEYRMYENMMKACENKSVVFISHRLSSATLADRIYLLEGGKVIEQGSHSALMAMNGKYAEMFRIQAENYLSESEEEE